MTLLPVTECLCHKWPWLCFCLSPSNPFLSSLMTYHQIFNMDNMTGVTSGTGTANPSGAFIFIPFLEFEDMKEVIRILKSKKDRHTMAKRKRTSNDLQNNTQKTKDRAIQTLLKTADELRCSTSDTYHVTLVTNNMLWMRKGLWSAYGRWNISIVICDTDIP